MRQRVTLVERHSQKTLLKIKIIEKLETIIILQVNTEVQQDLMLLTKFLHFFAMAQITITTS